MGKIRRGHHRCPKMRPQQTYGTFILWCCVDHSSDELQSLTSPTRSGATIVDSLPHTRQTTNIDAQVTTPPAEVQSGVYSDGYHPGHSGPSPEKGDGSPSTAAQTVHVIGQSTGWAAMSKDIRNYDENRIKECRDSIDTLMTFVSTARFALQILW